MRIPDPPPGFAVHGAALQHVSRDDVAANETSGRCMAALGLAAVHDAMRGHSCDHGSGLADAVAVQVRVAQALHGVSSDAAIQVDEMAFSPRAIRLAQLFGGEHTCP